MEHDGYKEMLAASALSALDTSDNRALNEHLLVCRECRDELENWKAAAATISLGSEPVEPSAAVRERLLSQIHAERRSRNSSQQADRSLPNALPIGRVRSTAASYALIAAGVVLSLFIGWMILLWRESTTAKAELARLKQQINVTEMQLAQQREIVTILSSPGAKLAELSAADSPAGSARATLAYNSSGQAVLIASNLPAAPDGKEYQLWFIVGNKPLPGKVFNTDESGSGTFREQMPAEVGSQAVFAVTVEPRGGVSAPTGPMLLRSEL